jgi:hypothetical protein
VFVVVVQSPVAVIFIFHRYPIHHSQTTSRSHHITRLAPLAALCNFSPSQHCYLKIYLKMELEKSFSRFVGPPPRFRPTAESRPSLLSVRPCPLRAAALARPILAAFYSSRSRALARCPDRGRDRVPRGRHAPFTGGTWPSMAPAAALARLLPQHELAPLLNPYSLPPLPRVDCSSSSRLPCRHRRHKPPRRRSCSTAAPPSNSSLHPLCHLFLCSRHEPAPRFGPR